MFSIRINASRVLLAWIVDMLPSWPVFMACSMSNASPPRTSPMMMRSGRIRRALRTSSRCVTSPLPSRLFGPRLETHHMRLLQLQFGGVLDCQNSFVFSAMNRDSAFIMVVLPDPVPPEMMMFSRQREAISNALGDGRRQRAEFDQLGEIDWLFAELADGDVGPVQCQRRKHDVDAGPVLKPGIDHRAGFIHPPADRSGDALADASKMLRVAKPNGGSHSLATPFDEHTIRPVDHDIADRVIGQQWLQRTQADNIMHQFRCETSLLAGVQLDAVLRRNLRDQPFHIAGKTFR